MGYYLTILKTDGRQQVPITIDEVESAVANLHGWKLDRDNCTVDYSRVGTDSFYMNYSPDPGELWQKASEHLCSNASMTQLLALANALSARLRGDEMETYRTSSQTYIHPDDLQDIRQQEILSKNLLQSHNKRKLIWDVFRLVVLMLCVILFIYTKIIKP